MRKVLLLIFLSTAIAGSISAQPTIAHAKYFTTSDCTTGCTFDLQ